MQIWGHAFELWNQKIWWLEPVSILLSLITIDLDGKCDYLAWPNSWLGYEKYSQYARNWDFADELKLRDLHSDLKS